MNVSGICVADHVVTRPVLGEMVLLDLATEQYFALNHVGTRLWELLSAGQSVDATTSTLLDEYAVSADVLEADIDWFLSRILALGFASGSSTT
jgi:hypothetical protein